jgi:mRNA interferase MazF
VVVVKPKAPQRGDVYLVGLDPTRGREIRKTRPCVVVSPNELNDHLGTVIVAPMTTGGHAYPFRLSCRFQRKAGFVVLDQLRTVDADRLHRRLGALSSATVSKALAVLREMFAE